MKNKTQQQDVCDVVIHLMEARKNDSLKIISAPDENERNKKAVDLYIHGSKSEYHLEHTLIESFPEQIEDGRRIMDLLAPIETSLAGKLPFGHFSLSVASGAVAGVTDTVRTQTVLQRWVVEKATLLSKEASTKNSYTICRETPLGVSFEVVLSCDPRLDDGFFIYRFAPEELEEKRRERIRIALDNKCPKLRDTKNQFGSYSVLILESNDIALANQSLIANAFADELSKRTDDLPDETYLVETELPTQWIIWILKEGSKQFPNIPDFGPHYIKRSVGVR